MPEARRAFPVAVQVVKAAVRHSLEAPLAAGLAYENELNVLCLAALREGSNAVIGIGIVGLGMAVAPHMLAIHDLEAAGRVRLLGGFARGTARRGAFAQAWHASAFLSPEALLAAPGLDLVIVLNPPGEHLSVVETAVKVGKHVLVEKPLEISLPRAEALVEAAERAGVMLGVVFQHRFRPAARRLKQAIADGELGDPLSCSASIRW